MTIVQEMRSAEAKMSLFKRAMRHLLTEVSPKENRMDVESRIGCQGYGTQKLMSMIVCELVSVKGVIYCAWTVLKTLTCAGEGQGLP
jgi:hypothetical protein